MKLISCGRAKLPRKEVIVVICALVIVAMFLGLKQFLFWPPERIFDPATKIESVEFSGQMKRVVISDDDLVRYFERCLRGAGETGDRRFDGGRLYNLTIRVKGLFGAYRTYIVLSGGGTGAFLTMQTFETRLGLQDARLVYIPFVEPVSQAAKDLITFLLSKSGEGKTLIAVPTNR